MITLPTTHRAGDALTASWDLADYPSGSGWSVRLTLINSGARYQATATGTGTTYALSVSSATTAAWTAGTYSWAVDATLSGSRTTLADGSIQILPDLAAATTLDTRSNLRKALDAAEAALATHGARAYLQSIEIGDRKQTFTGPSDFLAFISRLRAQVKADEAASRIRQGLSSQNQLLVRFRR